MMMQTQRFTYTQDAKTALRPNVAFIIYNDTGQVLLAKRCKQSIWQFPQGGIKEQETPNEALYRELNEELGLAKQDVECTAMSKKWHTYYLPKTLIRRTENTHQPVVIGQTQRWFLLRLLADDTPIRFDTITPPEMDDSMWVNYWFALTQALSLQISSVPLCIARISPLHASCIITW